MTTIAQQLLEQLKGFLEIDFAASPSYIFIGKLREELQNRGFDIPTSEALAVAIDVEISDGAATTEELGEFAQLYAELIEKSWEQLRLNGFSNPTPAILQLAKKMTLKISG